MSKPTTVPQAAVQPALNSMHRLGRNTAIYGLSVVLSRAFSLLLLPIYTRYLNPVDYGLLQLLGMVIDVLGILVSVGTTEGVLRFWFKAEAEEARNAVVVTAFYLLSGLNLIGAVIIIPAAPLLCKYALGNVGSPFLVQLAACSFVIEAAISVPMLLMQARQRAVLYSISMLGKLVLGLSLNILFVVGLGKGVVGILIANLLTSLTVGGILTAWMFRQTGFRSSAAAARNLRRFGVPYQFVTAGTFILTFGDRAFIQAFHGLAAVGIYGLAYQFGFVLVGLTSVPFFRAWAPQRLQLAVSAPREVRDALYNQAFRWLNLIVVSLAIMISLYVRPALALLSAPSFQPAAALVPVLLVAFVIQIWTDVVSLGIEVSERTIYATWATWMGVITVLLLYAVLIPPLAGLGAALATVGGYIVRFAFFYWWAQRLWPVGWKWGQPLRLMVIATVVVAFFIAVTPSGHVSQIALASGTLLAYAAVVWIMVLSDEERRQIVNLIRAPRYTFSALPPPVSRP